MKYALLLLTLPFPAFAQTVFFTGANGDDWHDGSHWNGGSPPTTSQIAGINGNSGGIGVSNGTIIVDTDEAVGGINFSGSVRKIITLEAGSSLTLHGTEIAGSTMLIQNSGNQTFTLNGDGTLVLAASGAIDIVNSNRGITLLSAIGETGGSRQIVKTGEGSLSFLNAPAAQSTFSGGVRVKAGRLSVNVSSTGVANAPTAGPLGTGTLALENGSVFAYVGSSAGTLHNAISVEGDVSLGTGTETRSVTLVGNLDLNGETRAVTVEQEVVLSGTVVNGGLTKRGASELRLEGINTYTGKTTVEGGTLTLAGSGSITASSAIEVASGATLAVANGYALAAGQRLEGGGTVTGTLRTGAGIIAPGGDLPGSLTVAGNAVFDGGAVELRLGDGVLDQLVLEGDGFSLTGNTTGSVQLTLSDFDGSATVGEYLLISTGGLTNATLTDWSTASFNLVLLPDHWTGALRMESEGLYFDLQAVPEPGVPFLLGAAGAVVAFLRRRKKA